MLSEHSATNLAAPTIIHVNDTSDVWPRELPGDPLTQKDGIAWLMNETPPTKKGWMIRAACIAKNKELFDV